VHKRYILFFTSNMMKAITFFSLASNSYTVALTSEKTTRETQSSSEYYKRYPSYPKYCSNPSEMAKRNVPPLNIEGTGLPEDASIDILQVSSIIRHGQRTPYAGNIPCWSKYKAKDTDTSSWDCELTTWSSPPRFDPSEKYLLFEKKYDALSEPLGNFLGGTCQMGQLIVPGYEQEHINGQILRDAYFGDANANETYGKNILFLDNDVEVPKPYASPFTFYRADDEQRTLMSGQVLLRGLFHQDLQDKDGAIELHTADYHNDVLTSNEQLCPTLTKLREEALQSDEFQQKNSSMEAAELREILAEDLGSEGFMDGGHWFEPMDYILDCLMTTMCTDRTLPDRVDDFGSTSDGRKGVFEQIVDFSVWSKVFHLRYNAAAYSKLGMGPLWYEILGKIDPLQKLNVAGGSSAYFQKMAEQGIPRLALYSGHDSTLMPLLASMGSRVWDGDWTPYASMIIIEVYVVNTPNSMGKFVFRLLYNGNVITDRLDRCPQNSELCSLDVLFETIGPFATNNRPSCAVDLAAKSFFGSLLEHTTSMLKNPMDKYIVIAVAGVSFLFGWFVTYVFFRRKIPFKGRRKPLQTHNAGVEFDPPSSPIS